MPKKSISPTEEIEEEPEQMSSPLHSEPDTGAATQERRRYKFSEGCEMAAELSDKLEEVKNIPITHEPRIVNLVAKFSDFPWAQNTVMAAHQLHEVLILFLWQHLKLGVQTLHR